MKTNTLVWCKTKEEVRGVLSEAKKMGYHMPDWDDYTERFWSTHESETVINLHDDGRGITYCYKEWYINHPSYGKIISANKFLGRRTILITRKGRIVTAEDKNSGEKAIATCSPTDTFDFGTGAMIAVARLIAKSEKGITKDAETVLRQLLGDDVNSDAPAEEGSAKFKIGDLVTLKEGVKEGDHFGHLDVEHGVMFDQGYHKPIKVIEISRAGSYLCVPAEGNGTDFYYHEEMLEPWDESKIREGDIVRVINTGLNYSTYPQWVGKHISDPDMAARYCFSSPSCDYNYKVIKIAEHEYGDCTLAYIEQCEGFTYKKCYLIEIKGLKRVTE